MNNNLTDNYSIDSYTEQNKPVYASFNHAQQHIFAIEPIDYFFAKELSQALTVQLLHNSELSNSELSNNQLPNPSLLFHLLMALSESLREGHSCLPLIAIANKQIGLMSDLQGIITHHGYLFPDLNTLTQYLTLYKLNDEPSCKLKGQALSVIVFNSGVLYLRRYYQFEQALSSYIKSKNPEKAELIYPINAIQQCLQQLFPAENPADSSIINKDKPEIDWQKVAVANAINKNFSIIAGGPGTGKTYTVIKLLAALTMLKQHSLKALTIDKELDDTPLKIALVAPTGKAAQRLSESIINALKGFRGQISDEILNAIPYHTQTIHRLLGVLPNSPNFKHNQNNLLAVDVLLIDEVSMVDLALMTRIFRALPQHTKVILLGDADQLPSVAVGSVLADIAPRPHPGFSQENATYLSQVTDEKITAISKIKPTDHLVFLIKSRRFDGEGGIGRLAKMVIDGKSEESWQLINSAASQPSLNLLNISSANTNIKADVNTHVINRTLLWLPELVKQYFEPMFDCNNVEQAFSYLAKFRLLCATKQGECGIELINDSI